MANEVYGKSISIADANQMATESMTIKNSYLEKINTIAAKDPKAQRFFCGGDALYIFSKSAIQPLLDRLTQPDDCLVIYPSCRIDEAGRPTLMVFAYQLKDGQLQIMKDETDGGNDGTEHPGGNGSFKLSEKLDSSGKPYYEISDSINPSKISFALE